MGTAAIGLKHPVPDRVKPTFVIFDIRALWRSGLSVRVPSKITNDCLTRSGTGCLRTVAIWQQWASKGFNTCYIVSTVYIRLQLQLIALVISRSHSLQFPRRLRFGLNVLLLYTSAIRSARLSAMTCVCAVGRTWYIGLSDWFSDLMILWHRLRLHRSASLPTTTWNWSSEWRLLNRSSHLATAVWPAQADYSHCSTSPLFLICSLLRGAATLSITFRH